GEAGEGRGNRGQPGGAGVPPDRQPGGGGGDAAARPDRPEAGRAGGGAAALLLRRGRPVRASAPGEGGGATWPRAEVSWRARSVSDRSSSHSGRSRSRLARLFTSRGFQQPDDLVEPRLHLV